MHSGELAIPSHSSFDPSYHLTLEVLVVNSCESSTFMQLTLKGSKTDGVKITVGRTGDKYCPVSAMTAYAVIRGNSKLPVVSQ